MTTTTTNIDRMRLRGINVLWSTHDEKIISALVSALEETYNALTALETKHSTSPYSYEEIIDGVMASERQIEAGDCLSGDEVDKHIEHLYGI